MFKQVLKQASIATIASSVVSGKIPTTGTHHALLLHLKTSSGSLTRANAIADITNVTVRINGTPIIDASAQALLDIFKYYHDVFSATVSTNCTAEVLTAASGLVLPIWFDRGDLASDSERQLFALGMADVTSFTVDLTCGASVNTANHVGSVDLYSVVSPQTRKLGQHIRIARYSNTLGAATGSPQEISSLPKEADTGYLALHCYHATVQPSNIQVKIGGRAIYDSVPGDIAISIGSRAGRSPQTNYQHVDFALSRDIFNLGFLPMAGIQDFRLGVTYAADPSANPLIIYAERIHGLNVKQ